MFDYLITVANLAYVTMPEDYNGSSLRCKVMNPESFVLDMIQCLENNRGSKQDKRTRRIQDMFKHFDESITTPTVERLSNALHNLKDNASVAPATKASTLEDLLAEMKDVSSMESSEIVFAKQLPTDTYKPFVKQFFHDECKKIVNQTGDVYDVFTAIAVISYNELLCDSDTTAIRQHLLKSSYLVFKGGASAGKFLFRQNKKLWESMTAFDKKQITDSFIKGGDNDTSLMFDKKAVRNGMFSIEDMNNEIGSLITDLQLLVLENVKKFNVEKIIKEQLLSANNAVVEFDKREFVIKQRKASSFMIADRNERESEILFIDDIPEFLFGSSSYLEFASRDGEMIKFHLARVKAGYQAIIVGDEDIKVNCYAECLDISCPLIDSAELSASVYQPIDILSFF